MGRTPLSGLPTLWRLAKAGHSTSSFGYWTSLGSFEAIRTRLLARLARVAEKGPYVVVGHSLGGVLLRSALAGLPAGIRPPEHVYLLGSPITSARLARSLSRNWLYRLLAGDCGQLLASQDRMGAIGQPPVATTCIVGTRGLNGRLSPFGQELNDGVVAVSEVAAPWVAEEIRVPLMHTFLPASRCVAEILVERLNSNG